ncbi:putative T3SS effector EspK [Hyphomicrobiales bacterium]|nr:putative T3SS effector EspK [Hyphomicrobiales bacterium]CAH1679742.1 putative T3SS effector EspK [Hyphomicrobiales bacterium]
MDPPFRERYASGDLLYGLDESRRIYCQRWGLKYSSQVEPFLTIDHYSLSEEEARARGRVDDHRSPTARQIDFWNTLHRHPVYSSVVGADHSVNGSWSNYEPETTRRKIKGGLHWAAHGRYQMAVHFILDGLDLRAVVEKNATWRGYELDCVDNGCKWRSFTGVELRWIYRNQADALVRSTVQFWKNFRPVVPPWEQSHLWWSGARLWSRYVPGSRRGSFRT